MDDGTIKVFVKFGYENTENNYYEYSGVSCVELSNDYLMITYKGKRTGTKNKVMYPKNRSQFGIIDVEEIATWWEDGFDGVKKLMWEW